MNQDVGLPPLPDLAAELRNKLAQVPSSRVTSFGKLAAALGDRGAARWVAGELATLRETDCPWHRVLRQTGELAAGAEAEQSERLRRERVDRMNPPWWNEFHGARPLRDLADWQVDAARHAARAEPMAIPDRVGAVDLSYVSDSEAVAAYADVDSRTLDLLDSECVRVPVSFPYIPGYLSFRELPALLALVERIRDRLAPVVLVDGSGRLHPRRFGVAVALGALTGLCTVGVSKHRLCGQTRDDDPEALWIDDELAGFRLDGGSKRRTLYVSPGTGIDAASARAIVLGVRGGRRLPVPIHWADALSRREATR